MAASAEEARLTRLLGELHTPEMQRRQGNGSDHSETFSPEAEDKERERLNKHWLGEAPPTASPTKACESQQPSPKAAAPVVVKREVAVRPKMKLGSAEQALRNGETEEQMLKRKMEEMKRNMQLKQQQQQHQQKSPRRVAAEPPTTATTTPTKAPPASAAVQHPQMKEDVQPSSSNGIEIAVPEEKAEEMARKEEERLRHRWL
ncbi:hypothetical protein QOT17_010043 [Balamuthia mandrillaris]